MNIKIDTKEKFSVITPQEEHLSANMTEELKNLLLPYLKKEISHVVFDMKQVKTVDEITGNSIALIQQEFYENNCSFVICNLQPEVEKFLKQIDLFELMNITPTESEAWDILQMEEVERELLSDDE